MPPLPDETFRLSTPDGKPDGLPLVVEPRERRDAAALEGFLHEHADWVAERLRRHGAILLRGFAIDAAEDFEAVARAIDPALGCEYLGTSPRRALTPHVFTASELPPYYPIPQHCEMSFVARPPRHQGFAATWLPGGGLRLVSTQALTRVHPETGERAWHNHLATFHLSSAPDEYRQILRRRPSARIWCLWQLSRVLVAAQRRLRRADEQSMHCTRSDGGEIPDEDVARVREAIARHMVVFSWRRGDVLAIDNYAVSHGRFPYVGHREIAVAWA